MQWSLADWAHLATIVTAVVAVLALVGVMWQVRIGRLSQREATASALYGHYLSLAVQHPNLASASIEIPPKDTLNETFESYEWFVSLMLHAFEQILELTEGDEAWRGAIAAQIKYHDDYLLSERFEPDYYSLMLRKLFPQRSSSAGQALSPTKRPQGSRTAPF